MKKAIFLCCINIILVSLFFVCAVGYSYKKQGDYSGYTQSNGYYVNYSSSPTQTTSRYSLDTKGMEFEKIKFGSGTLREFLDEHEGKIKICIYGLSSRSEYDILTRDGKLIAKIVNDKVDGDVIYWDVLKD